MTTAGRWFTGSRDRVGAFLVPGSSDTSVPRDDIVTDVAHARRTMRVILRFDMTPTEGRAGVAAESWFRPLDWACGSRDWVCVGTVI